MPRYTVQSPDGRKVTLEGNSPPTEQDLDQVFSSLPQKESIQQNASLGIEEGKLTPQERLSGGFRSPEELKSRRDTQAQALGVEQGQPLEPTGLNMENLIDIPNDILDMVGPAFPALGQFFAGLGTAAVTKNPVAAISAGGG